MSGDSLNPPHARFLTAALLVVTYIFLASCYFSIAVNSISMGLMAILWLSIMAVERRWSVARTPLDVYFLAFVLVQALSTVFSVDPHQSLVFSKRILLIALVYFFASVATNEQISKRLVAVFLGSAAIVATIGVGKLIFGSPEETVRLGIFQFYMTTSGVMTMAALFVFPFTIHPGTPLKIRVAAIIGIIPILISLWATVTRGAYIAAVAGLLFIIIVRDRRMLIPLVLIVLATVFFAPPYIESRIKSIVDLQHPENVSRLQMWDAGIKIFKDHPIVGVGDIDLGELMDHYAVPEMPRHWGHLHNVPLQVLVNYGIIGFLVIMAMFVKIVVTEWRIYRRTHADWFKGSFALGALAAFLGLLVSGLTEWTFGDQEVVTLIWTSLGLTLGLMRASTSSV
jgi:putative inorganic carbon (HCO3(-)) transporter